LVFQRVAYREEKPTTHRKKNHNTNQVNKTEKEKSRGLGATPPPLSTKIDLKRNPTARI